MALIPDLDIVVRLRQAKRRGSTCNEAANEIERLRKNLDSRDDFIVNKGLWDEFVKTMP